MILTRSVSKADHVRGSLPLFTHLRALAKGCLAVVILVLFGTSLCRAQGTYTAASCNRSDVNAVINGPTHTAANGDKIIIPAGSCTWTSTIVVSGAGIDITGQGTPNTGTHCPTVATDCGAGAPTTTLINNANGPFIEFTNLSLGQTAEVELLNLNPVGGVGSNTIFATLAFQGTCTSSGCANIRVDNINWQANAWETPLSGGFVVTEDVFGVVDHTTATESTADSPTILQVNYASWQGVGDWGDNSFAAADTLGTGQAMYAESNNFSGIRGGENDVSFNGNPGGARYVCRFNLMANMSGTGICSGHGTAWSGRPRGQRQIEAYYNVVSGSSCNAVTGLNSGVGYYFNNAFTGTGCNVIVALDIPRVSSPVGAPWNQCDGTQPFDQSPFTSSSQCLDQPGRSGGLLMQGGSLSPVAEWPNPALDPIYEGGDTIPNTAPGVQAAGDVTSRLIANRDYYAEVSQSPQSSATTPFNGTVGTGYGTLANRPTTCTTGVGYWATDQGTWNNGAAGFELFKCTSTNTWTLSYTPFTFPHPLVAGGSTGSGSGSGGNLPSPPTSLTATVN